MTGAYTPSSGAAAASATGAERRVRIVVPWSDEHGADQLSAFEADLARHAGLGLIVVERGGARLPQGLAARFGGRVEVMDEALGLTRAEAIRAGLRRALADASEYVGYVEVPRSAPPVVEELVRALDQDAGADMAVGVPAAAAPGSLFERVLTAAVATFMSVPGYDVRLHALLLRGGTASAVLDRPLRSRCLFDLELVARQLASSAGTVRAVGVSGQPAQGRLLETLRALGELADIVRKSRVGPSSRALFRLVSAPFLRYMAAGGVGTAAHYAVLILLVRGFGAGATSGAVAGALVGAGINYVLNYHMTFVSSAPHRSTLPRYLVVAALSVVVSGLGMLLLVERLGVHYLVAQLACTFVVLVLGYLVNRSWTFGKTAPRT